MKWQVNLVVMTSLALSACGFQTKESKREVAPAVAPIAPAKLEESKVLDADGRKVMADPKFNETLKKIEHGNYELGERLEPGSIVFSGSSIASENTNQTISVDQRVVINMESRLNFTRVIGDEELTVMTDVTDLKTYINIGCDKIDPSQVQGLTRIKPKLQHEFLHVHAKKIFVCGKHVINQKNTVFYAEEMMMNGASFGFSKGGGVINFCAKTLSLNGETRLFTNVKKADSLDQPGSPVFISVIDKLKGEGTLKINQQ